VCGKVTRRRENAAWIAGRYALVYSVQDDAEEDDGIPTRSSAKIDGSKRAHTMLVMWQRG
jgi:hypothetical protein